MRLSLTNDIHVETDCIESVSTDGYVYHANMVSGKSHQITAVLYQSIMEIIKNKDKMETVISG